LGYRYEIRHLADRGPIRDFLNRDRALTAYALGDLDEAFWPQSMFYGAVKDGRLASVVLFYRGFEPVVLVMFGELDGARAILDDVMLPQEIYYVVPRELGGPLSECYTCPDRHTEWRMVLDAAAFDPPRLDTAKPIRAEQADLLAALYRLAAAPGEQIVAFSPWQIAHGVFYGGRGAGRDGRHTCLVAGGRGRGHWERVHTAGVSRARVCDGVYRRGRAGHAGGGTGYCDPECA
jgi:hypothetical protein